MHFLCHKTLPAFGCTRARLEQWADKAFAVSGPLFFDTWKEMLQPPKNLFIRQFLVGMAWTEYDELAENVRNPWNADENNVFLFDRSRVKVCVVMIVSHLAPITWLENCYANKALFGLRGSYSLWPKNLTLVSRTLPRFEVASKNCWLMSQEVNVHVSAKKSCKVSTKGLRGQRMTMGQCIVFIFALLKRELQVALKFSEGSDSNSF